MGSGLMMAPAGKTWKENPNSKGLDNPRQTRGEYVLTSCVSVGVSGGSGGSESRMQFSSKQSFELWGKQTRTYVQPKPPKESEPKKMSTPDKK